MTAFANVRQILVPHDFGVAADHALDRAIAIAHTTGANVRVVHVYEAPTYGFPEAMLAAYEFASIIEHDVREALGRIVEQRRGCGVTIETELRRGTPWREINTAATESKADLIVMGTHGRQGVPRMVLGSVAEKVVRTAPCSVLTVRSQDAAPEPTRAGAE